MKHSDTFLSACTRLSDSLQGDPGVHGDGGVPGKDGLPGSPGEPGDAGVHGSPVSQGRIQPDAKIDGTWLSQDGLILKFLSLFPGPTWTSWRAWATWSFS